MTPGRDSCIEAQRGLIGILLFQPEKASEVIPRIRDAGAFQQPMRDVFIAMRSLYESGRPISQVTVRRELEDARKDSHGMTALFVQCMACANSSDAMVPAACADIVWEDYVLRRFRDRAQHVRSAKDASRCMEEYMELCSGSSRDTQRTLAELIPPLLKRQADIEAGREQNGFTWGLAPLDELCYIRPGHLHTVGGIKGGGKTLWLLHVLASNLSMGTPGLLFSMEMSSDQVAKRIITRHAEINSRLFPSKFLGARKSKILASCDECKRLGLTIDDAPDVTVMEIVARTRAWKIRNRVERGIIGVDFLQLINQQRDKNTTEASALKHIAYQLAKASKELGLAFVATAQLNNSAEGVKPHLRHLEGSGGIAQASEVVLMLDLVSRRKPAEDEGPLKRFNVLVEKQRDGESGIRVRCLADMATGRFLAIADGE